MRCNSWPSAVLAILTLGFATPARANLVYSVAPFSADTTLYRIDPETGATQTIGKTGVETLIGIAVDTKGRLLTIDAGFDNGRHLYQLNTSTGAASVLFDLGFPSNFGEGDLAIDPVTDKGFAVTGPFLYSLNVNNGAFKELGNLKFKGQDLDPNTNIDGLAFRGGALYGLVTIQGGDLTNHFIQIDPKALKVTDIGATGIEFPEDGGGVAGMSYDPAKDRFYATGTDFFGLYAVSPKTGHATLLSGPDVVDVSGLAPVGRGTVVPLPPAYLTGGASLLLVGIVSGRRRFKEFLCAAA